MQHVHKENHFKKSSDKILNQPSRHSKNTTKSNTTYSKPSHQAYTQKVEDDVQEVSVIKSEPREPVQQRAPVRSYQYQTQARYDQHMEQEHELVQEQIFDEDNGNDIEQGTVALDDAGYEYQYDDPGYEASEQNIDYNNGQDMLQGEGFINLHQYC